uniref:NUDIX domain-containing protein n=1 Tax=Flavobacterium sp. TaxID=239 RepID=UPI0040479579
MLDVRTFSTIVKNAPLISLDLCLVCEGKILLCMRENEPLKGQWFTPGGRIHKNETWQRALLRIAQTELGLRNNNIEDFVLMGIWDHFYSNSIFAESTSTHYVNLPHFACFKTMPLIVLDDQHAKFDWLELELVSNSKVVHPYVQNYAKWLTIEVRGAHD